MKTRKTMRRPKLMKFLIITLALSLVFAVPATSVFATYWRESGNLSKNGMFNSNPSDYRAVYDEADAVLEEVVNEGTALLKNDGTLPLDTGRAGSRTKLAFFNDANMGNTTVPVSKAFNDQGYNVTAISGVVTSLSAAQLKSISGIDAAVVRLQRTAGEANDLSTGRGKIGTSRFSDSNTENFGAITWVEWDNAKSEYVKTAWTKAKADAGLLFEAWPDGTLKGWNHKELAPNQPLALYSTDNALESRDISPVRHELMLTLAEEQMIQLVKQHFGTIIVIWECITQFELWDLENDPAINAIIHCGRMTGGNNFTAQNNSAAVISRGVAKVMSGEVNPSAHLVSQWDRDMTADPSWQNVTDGFHNDSTDLYRYSDGTPTGAHGRNTTGGGTGLHGVEYEEGIYLGYKYYETYWNETAMGKTPDSVDKGAWSQDNQDAADRWHYDNVTYPYGYGLSYATFDYQIEGIYTDAARNNPLGAIVDGSIFASDEGDPAEVKQLYVQVKVKNTSSFYAGKAVVQLYVSAPYITGGVEKAYVHSLEFDKTRLLGPGQNQTLVIPFDVQDMSSFDYDNRAAASATGGYILDEGDYVIHAMSSASVLRSQEARHGSTYDSCTFEIQNGGDAVALRLDDYTDNLVVPIFSTPNTREYTIRDGAIMADKTNGMTILSRSNLAATFPASPTFADRTLNDHYIDDYVRSELSYVAGYQRERATIGLTTEKTAYPAPHTSNLWYVDNDKGPYVYKDNASQPWYMSRAEFDAVAGNWTQRAEEARTGGKFVEDILLREMSGKPLYVYDASGNDSINPAWDEFMNQLTLKELRTLASQGNTQLAGIDSIGKNNSSAHDNTSYINSMYHWGDQPTLARTYNKDIFTDHGRITAQYAALGFTYTGSNTTSPSGWWSPGANLQRSPFSGRNGDYYGQDSLIAGIVTSWVTRAAEENGLACWIKHPILNDHETNRNGYSLFTWADEQTMRENYFPNAQKSFQEGKASGNMQSFARIGGVIYAYSYGANIELYRHQWGWTGFSCTDMLAGHNGFAFLKGAATSATNLTPTPRNWWDAAVGISGATFNKNKANDQTKEWVATRPVTLDLLVRGANGVPDANNSGNATHTINSSGVITGYSYPSGIDTYSYAVTNLNNVQSRAVSGTWAPLMENGKGGVYLEEETGSNTAAIMNVATAKMTTTGYHQWYNVRMTAMYACYEAANSLGNRNGMLTTDRDNQLRYYDSQNFTVSGLAQGTAMTEDRLQKDQYGRPMDWNGNTVTFAVTSGNLPEGLSLNASTGMITGTPASATVANTQVTIQCRVANYMYGNRTVTFAPIASAFSTTLPATVKVGKAIEGSFTSAVGTGNYTATGLPAGVTLSTAGVVSGAPVVAGTYNIVVSRNSYTYNYTLTVAGIIGVENIAGVLVTKYSDGSQEALGTLLTQEQVEDIVEGYNYITNAALTGFLKEADVKTLIEGYNYITNAALAGFLKEADVKTLIEGYNYITNAALTGYLKTADLKALTDTYGYLTSASLSGYLKTADLKALTDTYGYLTSASLSGYLKTADLKALTDGYGYLTNAAITGFKTEAEIKTIIEGYNYITAAAIAGKLDEAQVKTLIEAAVKNNLTVTDIQKMIDDSVTAHKSDTKHEGCGSSTAAIAAVLSLLAMAFVVIIKKQF